MPYPPYYHAKRDFALSEQNGEEVSGVDLMAEFSSVGESLNQLVGFIRNLATANREWQPGSALAQDLAEESETTATSGQTDFDLPNNATADPAEDKVRVFSDGVLIDPSDTTLNTDSVTIPARNGGETVVVELFNDSRNLRQDLADSANGLGASLSTIEDALGLYTADNVEDALAEVRSFLNDLTVALGDLSALIRSDGSVDFASDQSMGGHRLTNLEDGVDPQDAATINQLAVLANIFGDLNNVFLALSGGTMSGILDMGNNAIVNLEESDNETSAATVGQVNEVKDYADGTFLPTTGGQMSGEINMGANKVANIPDATDPKDAVPLSQVEELISSGGSGETIADQVRIGGSGHNGFFEVTAGDGCVCPGGVDDLSRPGVYNLEKLSLTSQAFDVAWISTIHSRDDAVISNTVSVATAPLQLYSGSRLVEGQDLSDDFTTEDRSANATFTPGTQDRGVAGGPNSDSYWSQPLGGNGAGGKGGLGAASSIGQVGQGHKANVVGVLAGAGQDLQESLLVQDLFCRIKHTVGGAGYYAAGDGYAFSGYRSSGGGSIIIMVDGDLTMTGGVIEANGEVLDEIGASERVSGPGGGQIIVICTGSITDGTFRATGQRGQRSSNSISQTGGGGGGAVLLVASGFLGEQVFDVTGGAASGANSEAGEEGSWRKLQLTAEQIRSIMYG